MLAVEWCGGGRGVATACYVMRIGYFCAGLGAAAVLFANARAEACSCLANEATGVWPRDGAMGAAVDTPLVVEATRLEYVTATLVAADGTVVELQERRRLVPPGAFECGNYSYAFLAAATELAANTRYFLTAHFDNEADVEGRFAAKFDRTLSFVTGTERRDSAVPEIRLSLFGVAFDSPPGRPAGTLLDVYLETEAIEPLFVVAHGERDVLVRDLNPGLTDRPFGVGFGAVECAALTVVDVTGTTVADRVLCEPSKCTVVASIAESSCEVVSRPSVDWSTWQNLPEGCDREALLQNAEEHPAVTDGPAAVDLASELEVPMLDSDVVDGGTTPSSPPAEEASSGEALQAAGGCGLSAHSPAGSALAVSCLLLAGLVRVLRRG